MEIKLNFTIWTDITKELEEEKRNGLIFGMIKVIKNRIKVLLNLVLTTQKIDHSFNHSFVIDSYQLNIKKKEGLESKFDILNDNIKQFIYKVDTERIESKRQHRELINQLYKDRKELKHKHS